MNVWIRADAGSDIGTGHVMRCLTLADRLKGNANLSFVCQERPGDLIAYIREKGFAVHSFRSATGSWEEDSDYTLGAIRQSDQSVDRFVVDHYGLASEYETRIRTEVGKLMAIDDLADRAHECDWLLDQNPYADAKSRYENLVNGECVTLLGPSYALLRPDFARTKEKVYRTGKVDRLLVSFGGADLTNEATKTLRAIVRVRERTGKQLPVSVLAGRINPHAESIRELCAGLPDVRYFAHAENVAELMAMSDLAIGSGGTTTWERCCVGLPALVVTTADNQVELSVHAAKLGVIGLLGANGNVDEERIADALIARLEDKEGTRKMSEAGMALVDGIGADRIMKELLTC
ncbi:UDP-2,4-diacetamido-2,4,6-trideoxy-beta-L-altropyranose hydrolase [Cohnella soli]|uniref:UDP-2,4-diacetamido-2,4, 6-trideoxy-beta-L-altropyranose hydrolase n=1 Tax=Cohnella soli TaxID=425005 RepID=A0ABW0HYR0_9BACL